MAKIHSFVNTTRCVCWDVDAFNAAGIGAIDFDNGQLVARGALKINDNGGYEFAVAAPVANATGLWVVDTPEVGTTLAMQMYDDPREFYNPAGQPMSIRKLMADVDFIEVPALAFAEGSDPTTQPTYNFVTVNTNGRLVIAQQAPAQGTYFSIAGKHTIDIGQEIVPTWILKCERN